MAERRMFSKAVVDSDRFLDMALSAQALYFHLGVHADDDGFIANPKKIQRSIRANDGDFKELIREGYVLVFESGVIVITDWKKNNFLRSDRYKQTNCIEEKRQLGILDGSYIKLEDAADLGLLESVEPAIKPKQKRLPSSESRAVNQSDTSGIPDGIPGGNQSVYQAVTERYTQDSIGKDRLELDKESIGGNGSDEPTKRKRFSPPTIEEVEAYCKEKGYTHVDAEYFWNYYENINWHVGKNKMKSWKLAVANWEKRQKEFLKAKGQVSATQEIIPSTDTREWPF